MVFIVLAGPVYGRQAEAKRYFASVGYLLVDWHDLRTAGCSLLDVEDDQQATRLLIGFVTRNYQKNCLLDWNETGCCQSQLVALKESRPCVVTVWLGLQPLAQYERYCAAATRSSTLLDLAAFLQQAQPALESGAFDFRFFDDAACQMEKLFEDVCFENRPDWKHYFMQMAVLASSRSNCMKRKVGAILEADRRVLATGYNGTPSGLQNCNEGGCPRCNNAAVLGGTKLEECYCIHAEENALLEAGGKTAAAGSNLYSTSFPCLGCAKKIIQLGVQKVFYLRRFHADSVAGQLFAAAGVQVEQLFLPAALQLPCSK